MVEAANVTTQRKLRERRGKLGAGLGGGSHMVTAPWEGGQACIPQTGSNRTAGLRSEQVQVEGGFERHCVVVQ